MMSIHKNFLHIILACALVPCVFAAQVPPPEASETPTQKEMVTPPTQKDDTADIYLNFQDASLASVVNYLAEQRKINFIPHKDLANKKVTLTTREPLTLDRAWNILLTLLEMNDFSMIQVGSVYRIVNNKENKREPLPLYSAGQGVEPKDLPDSDLVVRYIYILKNISTEVAERILNDLLGRDKVQTNRDLGTCIITDKCYNIKSAMKIVQELDTGGLREAIKIFRLRYTEAEEIARLFTQNIMDQSQQQQKTIRFIGPREKKEITYFSNTTKIIPEPRHNALILLGLEQNIDRVIEFIQKYLDVPMEAAESRIHIKELKYVEATKVKPILDAMTKPPEGKGKTPLVGEFKFFEDVVVHAESSQSGEESRGSGNRLVISCNKDDWRRLEQFIDKLDKPQPQVAMEVMVVDVDGQNLRNLGTQIREKTGKSFGKGLTVFTTNLAGLEVDTSVAETDPNYKPYDPNLIGFATGKQGTTAVSVGKPGDVWAVIKSFFSKSYTNIISQPFMITTNNTPCTLSVSQTRRVSGKLDNEGGRSVAKKEDIDAKTTIKLTPRINVTGLVDLQIDISLIEFLAEGDADRPPRSTRSMTTRTSMATGEVLVLGGLTKNRVSESHNKTPLLGDIPIIGNLFRSKTKTTGKTNLYIFIRPSIIKPRFEGGADEYTQLKLDYAKYQILNVEDIRFTKDPIQRWFFKPDTQSVKQKLSDLRKGVYRPLDDYIEGKSQPRSVQIQRDPYFRPKKVIKKIKEEELKKEQQRKEFKEKKPKELLSPTMPHYNATFAKNKTTSLPSLRKRKRRRT